MLFAFAISISPVSLLHSLFADHADTPAAVSHSHEKSVSKIGIHCNCNDLVVASVFTVSNANIEKAIIFSSEYLPDYFVENYFGDSDRSVRKRGPPAPFNC